jgi:ATP-binding protein involved in chromosome partitioning
MASPDEIKQGLRPEIAQRVVSIRLTDGVATLVVDAAGLGRAEAAALQTEVEDSVKALPGISEVRVALMADKVQRRIVAVGSGKGGVGKSTLTANLAVALARAGRKVGVVDADIYGPSQPMLLGASESKPTAEGKQLIPVESEFGVKLLSMGQLVAPGKALAWRGPMTGGALGQLMDAAWGDTELLLVDLPPGTGDVQLTMLQKFKPAGAIVVSTPQDLALIDATRALDLFRQGDIPIIGIVENMAGYLCPHCGEPSDPFGTGGAEAAARALGEAFLGRIPLAMEIRVASDTGQPPAANDTAQGQAFADIAARLGEWLDRQ